MEKVDLGGACWESDEETAKADSCTNGKEMSVVVQTHCSSPGAAEIEPATSRKCTYKQHFVEESTLRNISLDELEELRDSTNTAANDTEVGRASSSASSEQNPVKYALWLEWDSNYFRKPDGLLRLALLFCSTLSLICVTSAGTAEVDVLQLPVSAYIRAHIFVTVFVILATLLLFFIHVTSLIESFPVHWNITDAAIHASLSTLFIFASSMLLHAQQEYYHIEPPLTEWTKVQMTLAAVFGYLSTICCVFLTILRSCATPRAHVAEEIILTSLRSSS